MDINNDSKQNYSMSCKMEHQTRKHKDAWEINCSYNIYKYIYIYIYMQQSFFGFFIDAGASKGLISITTVATIIQQEG